MPSNFYTHLPAKHSWGSDCEFADDWLADDWNREQSSFRKAKLVPSQMMVSTASVPQTGQQNPAV